MLVGTVPGVIVGQAGTVGIAVGWLNPMEDVHPLRTVIQISRRNQYKMIGLVVCCKRVCDILPDLFCYSHLRFNPYGLFLHKKNYIDYRLFFK